MLSLKFKKQINEDKIKVKKTVSLLGNSIETDWVILVSVFFVFLLCSLTFSWFVYVSVTTDSVLSEEEYQQKSALKVNNKQLEETIKNIESRKQKFESLNI